MSRLINELEELVKPFPDYDPAGDPLRKLLEIIKEQDERIKQLEKEIYGRS